MTRLANGARAAVPVSPAKDRRACARLGGLATEGLRYAAATGAEAIQVFVSNPRAWALSDRRR